jgi:hypothetical protein
VVLAEVRAQAVSDYLHHHFYGFVVCMRGCGSQATLLESFAPEKRGLAMAVFALGVVVAPVLGPRAVTPERNVTGVLGGESDTVGAVARDEGIPDGAGSFGDDGAAPGVWLAEWRTHTTRAYGPMWMIFAISRWDALRVFPWCFC